MPRGSAFLPRPVFLLVLLCPALATGAWLVARSAETGAAHVRFDRTLTAWGAALHNEVRACTDSLYALRSLFRASHEVTREEFATFARDACERNARIHALEWVPRVLHSERAAFEARVRGEGFASYGIRDRLDNGPLAPAEARDEYFPVCFVEPRQGSELVLGHDLWRNGPRREVVERALATGEAALSDPITLIREPGAGPGILAVLALSAEGSALEPWTAQACVALEFSVRSVVAASILGGANGAPPGTRLVLEDADGSGTGRRVYASAGVDEAAPASSFPHRLDVDLGGQRWRLYAAPSPAFLDAQRTGQPALVAIVALLASGLLCWGLLRVGRASRKRSDRAHELTMSSVLASLDDGVLVADRDGRVQFANEAAHELNGGPNGASSPAERAPTWGLYGADGATPCAQSQLPMARALRGEHVVDEPMVVRNARHPGGRWLRVSAAPVIDAEGTRRGGVVVSRDVTRSREAHERLQRLSSAVDQTADAVFITAVDGTILYVNPAFESMTGYSIRQALGKTPRILKSGLHQEGYYRALWQRILTGGVHRGTTINRRKDGTIYYAEQTITPMKDEQGNLIHFVSLLRDMTDVRLREERDVELRLAATVQKRLYPQASPSVEGLDVAGRAIPSEATCGDYFDYIPLPCGDMALVVGDVSGHGLGPALLMVETRAFLRSYLRLGTPIPSVFQDLHESLSRDIESDRFVTMILASIDPRARRLSYASAGAEALVMDRTGRIKYELTPTGPALGIVPDCSFRCDGPLPLEIGDVVVLLTDGLTETQSPAGELFETAGVARVIRDHIDEPARAILDHVFRAVADFAGGRPAADDQTLVICKVTETTAAAAPA